MYQLITSINTPPDQGEIILGGEFHHETEFVIEIFSPTGERRGWQRAGFLARMFDIPGIGLSEGEITRLYLERTKVIYFPSSEPFKLAFRPYYWIVDYQLKLWAREPEEQSESSSNNSMLF
ncbi:MAG: hypothetical protein F6J97_13095 [Leptolyngbya sp. SIO4C1]|nr:hypothetical protein [Leptolyngbya sp. SIO4C1]